MASKKTIIECLTILKLTYPNAIKDISKEDANLMISLWINDFEGYDDEILKQAINRIRNKNKYFPSIAEIKEELIKMKTKSFMLNAEDEWDEVLKAIRSFDFNDEEKAKSTLKPITRKVIGMVDSWRGLCMMTTEEKQFRRKDFINIFNREIGKIKEIEQIGKNITQEELSYKEQVLLEEQEIERQNLIELEN